MTKFIVVRNQPRGHVQLVDQTPSWNVWDYDRETVDLDIPIAHRDGAGNWSTILVCLLHGDYRRVVSRNEGRALGSSPATWCSECWADEEPRLTGDRRVNLVQRHRELQRTFGVGDTLSYQTRDRLLAALDEDRRRG